MLQASLDDRQAQLLSWWSTYRESVVGGILAFAAQASIPPAAKVEEEEGRGRRRRRSKKKGRDASPTTTVSEEVWPRVWPSHCGLTDRYGLARLFVCSLPVSSLSVRPSAPSPPACLFLLPHLLLPAALLACGGGHVPVGAALGLGGEGGRRQVPPVLRQALVVLGRRQGRVPRTVRRAAGTKGQAGRETGDGRRGLTLHTYMPLIDPSTHP